MLLALGGLEMARGRLHSQMAGRTFSYTRNRRSQFVCSSRQRRWRLLCQSGLAPWLVDHSATFTIFNANQLRQAAAHQRERWYQHPEPPTGADCSRQRNSDNQKRNAHEDVFERRIERRLPLTLATSPAVAVRNVFDRGLDHLARQRLRNETNIRATAATKTGAIEILSCTVWTKHSTLRSTSRRTRNQSLLERRLLPV